MRQFLQRFSFIFRRQRSRTVRYVFPTVLGSVAIASALALTSGSQGSTVVVSTPTQVVSMGEIVPILVRANATVPINAVEATLSFDTGVFEVFNINRGSSVITLWTEEPEARNGEIVISGGTYRRGFIGAHEIIEVNLRVINTGAGDIELNDVQLFAGDGQGTAVTAAQDEGALTLIAYDPEDSESIEAAVLAQLPTDVNGDGQVTLRDISAFMGAWSSQSRTLDFDGDNRMTFRDFSIILASYFMQ
jgi:hypothetical protein